MCSQIFELLKLKEEQHNTKKYQTTARQGKEDSPGYIIGHCKVGQQKVSSEKEKSEPKKLNIITSW